MKVDSNLFINIKMIYGKVKHPLYPLYPRCNTPLYKFHIEKVPAFKKVCKDFCTVTLIKMLGLNISLTKILSIWAKHKSQTITYNGKLSQNYLSTKVAIYENLKLNSSVSLPSDPDSVIKEVTNVHLRRYICLNSLKATFSVLNFVYYARKVRGI